MTGPEFDAIRPLLNISDDRVSAARSALVGGQTLQGVASLYGWSRQAVGDAVSVVWQTYERYQESQRAAASAGTLLPPGWEQVTLIAPSALIADFRQQIATAAAPTLEPAPAPPEKTTARPNKKPGAGKRSGQTST